MDLFLFLRINAFSTARTESGQSVKAGDGSAARLRVRARHMTCGRECVCERRAEVCTCAGSYSAESPQHGVRMRARKDLRAVITDITNVIFGEVMVGMASSELESSRTVAVAEGL